MGQKSRRGLALPKTVSSFEFANTLAQAGRPEAAIEIYEALLAKQPKLYPVLSHLSNLLRKQGRLDDAGKLAQKAIKIAPHEGALHTNLGHIRLDQGRITDALVHYEKAVSLSPDVAEGYNGLGSALIAAGASTKAISPLTRAIELDFNHLFARINLGLALVDLGRAAEALEQAEIVVGRSGEANFPHFQTGILLARAGCPDGARVCFHAYLASDPLDGKGARVVLASLAMQCRIPHRLRNWSNYTAAGHLTGIPRSAERRDIAAPN